MNHACQSLSTLKEMLGEAARLVASSHTPPGRDLSSKIDELRQSLETMPVVSAEAENEILSLYVLAELERTRARSTPYDR